MILKHVSTVENCILFVSDILLRHSYDFYSVKALYCCASVVEKLAIGQSEIVPSTMHCLIFYDSILEMFKTTNNSLLHSIKICTVQEKSSYLFIN